ncbi:TonB-dependent receptor [bacterium]|nr:TonB-dependent receptor [bacterium]
MKVNLFLIIFFLCTHLIASDYTVVVRAKNGGGDEASSSSKISSREIEEQLNFSLVDAAKMLPGLSVTDGGGGAFFSVRGLRSRNLLVLLDGIPLVSPISVDGSYDMRGFSTMNIASITLLKGPHAVLYGSGAMGGVLLLQTKRGNDGFKISSRLVSGVVDAGENNSYPNSVDSSLSVSYGKNGYSLSGGFYLSYENALSDAGSYGNLVDMPVLDSISLEHDGHIRGGGTLSLHIDFPQNGEFSLFSYLKMDSSDADDGAGPLLDDLNRTMKRTEFVVSPSIQFYLSPRSNSTLSFSLLASTLEDRDGADVGKVYEDMNGSFVGYRSVVAWKNSVTTEKFLIQTGLSFTRSWGESHFRDNSTFRLIDLSFTGQTNNLISLWGHASWTPVKKLTFIAGVRGEAVFYQTQTMDRDTDELLPAVTHAQIEPLMTLGVVWKTPISSTVRARGGRSFRTPTLFELYSPYSPKYDALEPEIAWGVDGGYTQYFYKKKIALGATLFWERIYNQIDVDKSNTFVNRAMTENAGLELELRTKKMYGFSGRFAWTWLFMKQEYRHVIVNEDRYKVSLPLLRRPTHTISAVVNWNWKKKFNINFRTVWRGPSDDEIYLPPRNPYIETIPAFVICDIAISWKVHRFVKLLAKVENMFNQTGYAYSAGYSTPGISPKIGIEVGY